MSANRQPPRLPYRPPRPPSCYPIVVGDIQRAANLHDVRRTYARRLHEAGVDFLAIQQNPGQAGHKTTGLYIGRLNVGAHKPPTLMRVVYQGDRLWIHKPMADLKRITT